ncbi:D-alanyl-D-alanine carboxypeptidase [Microbacterium trichothecenolyticum]|uniref:M15 family metallopeptidase n=1 Tax=Microbacterium trichothecenolyticum TaxID=69370 RepID=UPI00285F3BF1|nr:M15 family metallopeptidase [Microbacterium trichothecenolyticum]MDR7184518.1 D-alanyl-D-alanine carboxypeptidase [Microbacterium trichothecenolyticum]
MTEPGGLATPRAAPETRRAARAMREEAARRARGADSAPADVHAPVPDPADQFLAFELPSDEFMPGSISAGAPSALPLDLRPTGAAPHRTDSTPHRVPEARVRGRRRAVRSPRPVVSERRAARADGLLEVDESAQPVRHARPRRLTKRLVLVAGLATGAALLLGSAAMTAMMLPSEPQAAGADAALTMTMELPEIEQLPVPQVEESPPAADICALPDVAAAVQRGDDEAAIVAAGGGEAFRAAVVEGRAPCVNLGDSARVWTVMDKIRPASPIDYRPSALVLPDRVRNIEGGALRSDAASALASLVTAARNAGVGEIALESGFRSYQTQQQTYGRHFAEKGERADQVSARPGYSEHQLGLSADVVACAGSCGTLDQIAATPQGQFVAEHSWEHGWIVRYVEGATPVTGYLPEPWHLRYVGPELAKAYHDGGWTSLEEFFALDPAPDYLG